MNFISLPKLGMCNECIETMFEQSIILTTYIHRFTFNAKICEIFLFRNYLPSFPLENLM